MIQYLDFLTDDYLEYAAECRRMAAIAQRNEVTASIAKSSRWSELAARFMARLHSQQAVVGLAAKPVYA